MKANVTDISCWLLLIIMLLSWLTTICIMTTILCDKFYKQCLESVQRTQFNSLAENTEYTLSKKQQTWVIIVSYFFRFFHWLIPKENVYASMTDFILSQLHCYYTLQNSKLPLNFYSSITLMLTSWKKENIKVLIYFVSVPVSADGSNVAN